MENQIFELQYALDTFYFLVCGALVMWMAAGFAMLEAGLVRAKNTTEILTKNVALYAVACTMYMVCGYSIMYGGADFSLFLSGIVGDGVAGAEELEGRLERVHADLRRRSARVRHEDGLAKGAGGDVVGHRERHGAE